MSLFSRSPEKNLDRAREALTDAERTAAAAKAAFEADPTEANAVAKLCADQRAINARTALGVAEKDAADAHRAALAVELKAIEKEINHDAREKFVASEVAREMAARRLLQDAALKLANESERRATLGYRAREIAEELGESTAAIDVAIASWRATDRAVCTATHNALLERLNELDPTAPRGLLQRSVAWSSPSLG